MLVGWLVVDEAEAHVVSGIWEIGQVKRTIWGKYKTMSY
jgi:hypothetical protein